MAQNIIEKWKPRFGETDKDTRGSDRLPVNALPSRLAIINVYELIRKKKVGGSADKKQRAQQKGKGQGKSGGRPPKKEKQSGFARYGEKRIQAGVIEGIAYDTEGFPMPFEGETKHDYNSRATKFINTYQSTPLPGVLGRVVFERKSAKPKKPKPDKAELKKTQEEESNIITQEQRNAAANARIDADIKIREQHKNEPLYILDAKVRRYQIRATPNEATIPPNKYIRKDPNDDIEFEEIKEAFKKAIANKMIPQRPGQPAAIIPVKASMMTPPKIYYISNELNALRRKKFMRSKAKRPLPMVKKPYGNKRKVVLKKKGGR